MSKVDCFSLNPWDDSAGLVPLFNLVSVAHCCGSQLIQTDEDTKKRPANTLGILICPTKIGRAGKSKLNTVYHVDTPEGVVTVVIRRKWDASSIDK